MRMGKELGQAAGRLHGVKAQSPNPIASRMLKPS